MAAILSQPQCFKMYLAHLTRNWCPRRRFRHIRYLMRYDSIYCRGGGGGGGGGFQSTLCLITFPRRNSQDGEVIEWASASNHIRETNVAQNYSPTPKMQINYISNKGSYACLIVTKLLIIIIGLVALKAIFFTSYFHLHFVEKVCCLPRH